MKDLEFFGKQCAGSTQLCESCSKTYLLSPPEWGQVGWGPSLGKNPEKNRVPLPYDIFKIERTKSEMSTGGIN